MNAAIFETYSPAIEGFLSSQTDKTCKPWSEVVRFFFEMNIDTTISKWTTLASTFANAGYPLNLRICAEGFDDYFDEFKITKTSLSRCNFVENKDFIEDEEGLRLSFGTIRELTFIKGNPEMIQAFGFIDKVYQLYVRYELAMIDRSRRPTHWTLLEQIGSLSQNMKPHIDAAILRNPRLTPKFLIMDAQPKVYVIVKGTKKTIEAKLKKIVRDAEHNPKFASRLVIPIHESVLPNIADEIEAVSKFIEQTRAMPFRQNQLGTNNADGTEINKIAHTKHNIKLLKTSILIDSIQTDYTEATLIRDIELVRTKLRLGNKTHDVKEKKKKTVDPMDGNSVDINIFERTNGQFIDEFMSIDLKQIEIPDISQPQTVDTDNDVVNEDQPQQTTEPTPEPTTTARSTTTRSRTSRTTNPPATPPAETPQPETPAPANSATRTRARRAPARNRRTELPTEEGEYNEDDQPAPTRQGRTNNAMRARPVRRAATRQPTVQTNEGYDTADSE